MCARLSSCIVILVCWDWDGAEQARWSTINKSAPPKGTKKRVKGNDRGRGEHPKLILILKEEYARTHVMVGKIGIV